MKHLVNLITIILVFVLFGCEDTYFNDSCGCKADWKEKLANSAMSKEGEFNQYRNGSTNKYIDNGEKMWENSLADNFISTIGGKKYDLGENPAGYELILGNDILWLYSDGQAWSTDYLMPFKWKFENNELEFYKEVNSTIFSFGKAVLESGKAVYLESEESKAERGVSENLLPSKVLDFCACKCEITDRGYSSAIASDSCEKFLKKQRYFLGDIKEVLESK